MVKRIPIDDDLWNRIVAVAGSTGRQPEEVVEDAVRRYVVQPADVISRLRPQEDLTDDEAMQLALREVKAYRSGR
jgi:Arc/MetJ family transcription regulator